MKKSLVVLVLGMTMFSCSKEDVQENNLIDNMIGNPYLTENVVLGLPDFDSGYEFITETTLNRVQAVTFDTSPGSPYVVDCYERSFLETGSYEWTVIESTKDVYRIKLDDDWSDWEFEFTKNRDNSITCRSRFSLEAGGGDWFIQKLYVANEITFCD